MGSRECARQARHHARGSWTTKVRIYQIAAVIVAVSVIAVLAVGWPYGTDHVADSQKTDSQKTDASYLPSRMGGRKGLAIRTSGDYFEDVESASAAAGFRLPTATALPEGVTLEGILTSVSQMNVSGDSYKVTYMVFAPQGRKYGAFATDDATGKMAVSINSLDAIDVIISPTPPTSPIGSGGLSAEDKTRPRKDNGRGDIFPGITVYGISTTDVYRSDGSRVAERYQKDGSSPIESPTFEANGLTYLIHSDSPRQEVVAFLKGLKLE